MTREGADWAGARPTQAQLKTAGVTFGCRYLLDAARNAGKRFTRAEALTVNGWGIDTVSNFEYATNGALLGYKQGVEDARTVLAEIKFLGIPRKVVYFSADFDLSISQIPAVLDYLAGCASILGKENVGVYGEYDLIEAAAKAGYKWLWQTYAWSRGLLSSHATLYQYHNGAFSGWDGDRDRALTADFGQWNLVTGVNVMDPFDPNGTGIVQPDDISGPNKPGFSKTLAWWVGALYLHVFNVENALTTFIKNASGAFSGIKTTVDTMQGNMQMLPQSGDIQAIVHAEVAALTATLTLSDTDRADIAHRVVVELIGAVKPPVV